MQDQEANSADVSRAESGPSKELQQLIEGLLEKHNFLHEYRLQKLVYLAELLYAQRTNGESLTKANFKPYRYGAYSEDVKRALKDLSKQPEIKAEHKRKYGNDTCTYKPNNLDKDHPEHIQKLVDIVVNLSRNVSNDELANWSKSTYLFDKTDYDDIMDFSEYIEYLDNGQEPDWKGLL